MMFYFWVLLMVACIVAVPVAARLSGGPGKQKQPADESAADQAVAEGAPAGEPQGLGDEPFPAEEAAAPIGEEDFADFK